MSVLFAQVWEPHAAVCLVPARLHRLRGPGQGGRHRQGQGPQHAPSCSASWEWSISTGGSSEGLLTDATKGSGPKHRKLDWWPDMEQAIKEAKVAISEFRVPYLPIKIMVSPCRYCHKEFQGKISVCIMLLYNFSWSQCEISAGGGNSTAEYCIIICKGKIKIPLPLKYDNNYIHQRTQLDPRIWK